LAFPKNINADKESTFAHQPKKKKKNAFDQQTQHYQAVCGGARGSE
jgi:hypothetical protein